MAILILILVAVLAFGNGANDNGKGVATLVGYGAAKPTAALAWATVTTLAGAVVSVWLARGMVERFSTGLFAAGTAIRPSLFVAVLAGAIAWVLLATATGMPVSTTHAIAGALIGAGCVAFGPAAVRWHLLGAKVAVPLVVSPLVALAAVYAISWPVGAAVRRAADRCVCVTATPAGGAVAMGVVVDTAAACEGQPVAVTGSRVTTAVHWGSCGLVGFARGWNDAPKIAALGLLAVGGPRGTAVGVSVVAVAMAVGGLVAGRRVLATLATKVTKLPLAESLTASLATATLVGLASWEGLPVSTTQVSTGAIVGAGLKAGPAGVRWGKVGEIVLSWVVTVPAAATVAAGVQACFGG